METNCQLLVPQWGGSFTCPSIEKPVTVHHIPISDGDLASNSLGFKVGDIYSCPQIYTARSVTDISPQRIESRVWEVQLGKITSTVSLVSFMANVMPKSTEWIVEGLCAYVLQTAWLRNQSIKVSLAHAIYSHASILLLDDVLSSGSTYIVTLDSCTVQFQALVVDQIDVLQAGVADLPMKKAPQKLVEDEGHLCRYRDEDCSVGRIRLDIWLMYIHAWDGYQYWVILGTILLVAAFSPLLENGWLRTHYKDNQVVYTLCLLNQFRKDFQGHCVIVFISAAITLTVISVVGRLLFFLVALAISLVHYKYRKVANTLSVSSSPLHSMYWETVSGITTLQAFGGSSQFLLDIMHTLDMNSAPSYWTSASASLVSPFSLQILKLPHVVGVMVLVSPRISVLLAGFTVVFTASVTNDVCVLPLLSSPPFNPSSHFGNAL
ncbi:hypothetical protein B0H10DRAFT_1950144 [Mycena sp. CBHHK59/15]|nr:hypothetical protein B0H10DRAFT_1950144 [Mycena sp. CBHHK59/15]